MVPLRSSAYDDSAYRTREEARPRLRLVTVSDEQAVAAGRPSIARKHRVVPSDQVCFIVVLALLATLSIGSIGSSLRSTVFQAFSGATHKTTMIGVVVKPGDSLWRYARRYGAPGDYILNSIDGIAHDNGIDPSAALVPGQHLRIHVENPILLAHLQRHSRVASVSY